MRRILAVLVLLIGLSVSAEARTPNVIFVLVDDMGYADLGCYGGTDIRTPHTDRLAREGVRMTDFYSNAPVCTPTRAAFITGRWQQRVGLEWALGFTAQQRRRVGDEWMPEPDFKLLGLPTSEPSLAKMLKPAGYGTGVFGKWHLGYRPEYNPTAHGFDEFFGVLLGHADFYTKTYKDGTYHLYEGTAPAKAEGYLTDLINERAVRYIEARKQEPFFMYVPYNAVHWPFQVPESPDSRMDIENPYKGTRDDYRRMLERIDDGVGQMLAALERSGVADDTLFIFSSDNGGERLSDNRPLFNHKTTLWEGGIRVPCVVRWPKGLPAGKVSSQPGITMDLTATILAATGAQPPEGVKLDGVNLLPLLTGAEPPRERTFYWRVNRTDRQQKAIRHGKWKYIQDAMMPLLFDLERDVGEREDLGYRHPEVLAKLQSLLADWEAEMAKSSPPFVVN